MSALTIENLHKTYKNGTKALNGINLQVAEGDFFALLGPNGAGKSTTIGIISSLVNKTSGIVRIFDHDLDTEAALAKSLIGLVPQEFNFNIFEQVLQIVVNQAGYYGVPYRTAYERAEYYLKELGLWHKRHQPARMLSGGMKRRLLIARALVHQPKLLVLDEPTAGVDIELRRTLWEFIKELNRQGTTIILTTHYLEEAESLCRNIAIIHQGNLIENTNMRDLLKKLDTETFILNLKSALDQPPELPGFSSRLIDALTLEVDIHKQQTINTIFSALSAQNIDVVSLRNKTNRLEELFLNLTADKTHG